MTNRLIKSTNGDTLEVTLTLDGTAIAHSWRIDTLVDKLTAQHVVLKKVIYPDDIPTVDTCAYNWASIPYDTVIVINSAEELQNYLVCHEDDVPPAIDFSTNTLLLAHGRTPSNIYNLSTELTVTSNNEYVLIVDAKLGGYMVYDEWKVIYIADKLNSSVKLITRITET
ncbi:MAG: hypothetical protein LBT48_05430 [Prevotellaceae bacterium]|nr:hypothetical protein [Prevotellaceae bacterium]